MAAERALYISESEAVIAWSEVYRSRGSRREYAAFIYKTIQDGTPRYYNGRTLAGMSAHGIIRANVFFPFLFLYCFQAITEWVKHKARIAAFIHTHPQPAPGYTSSIHSAEDLFLLKLPGVYAVYVIPYENQEMIRAERQSRRL